MTRSRKLAGRGDVARLSLMLVIGAAISLAGAGCGEDDDDAASPEAGRSGTGTTMSGTGGAEGTGAAGALGGAGGAGGAAACIDLPRLVAHWSRLVVPAELGARSLHAAAEGSGKLLISGGLRDNAPLGDAWLYDAAADKPWSAAQSGFPPRAGHAMAFDGESWLLFGGSGDDGFLNDTWRLGDTWEPLCQEQCASLPTPRSSHKLALDEATHKLVLFGGTNDVPLGDTWEWSSDAHWQVVCGAVPGGGGAGSGGAGGSGASSGGASGDAAGPSAGAPSACGPSPRLDHALAYHPTLRAVLLFGGSDGGGELGDLWQYAGGQWSSVTQLGDASPGARAGHGMTYDAGTDLMILVGGRRDGTDMASQVWGYSREYSAWLAATSDGPAPAPRAYASLTTTTPGTLVYYGGGKLEALGDAWSLKLERLPPDGSSCGGGAGAEGGAGGGAGQGGGGASAGGPSVEQPPEPACQTLFDCCDTLDAQRGASCRRTARVDDVATCNAMISRCTQLRELPQMSAACLELAGCCALLKGGLQQSCSNLVSGSDTPDPAACDDFLTGGYCPKNW